MPMQLATLSDVPAALDLVKEEVAKAEKAIRKVGADAMLNGTLAAAKEAIAYAEKLLDFASKVDRLGKEWSAYEKEIEGATPETRAILEKAGWTRVVPGPIEPWTNFRVEFPDGTVIAETRANATLARTIEKIGPAKVAALHGPVCLHPSGEPLVTRSNTGKYPRFPMAGGFFVFTQSNTAVKADTVRTISDMLGLGLKVSITGKATTPKPSARSSRPAGAGKKGGTFPYAVGKVVQAVFPVLQTDARMTEEAVKELLAPDSSARFKTGGNAVLKPQTGAAHETRDSHGYHRYYDKLPLTFHGRPYWLTSQFNPQGLWPVLDWLSGLGMPESEVRDICARRWGKEDGGQQTLPL